MRRHEDRLATEEPLEIRLAWPGSPASRVAVTMRTPGHDFELATGFLYGEGCSGPPTTSARRVLHRRDADARAGVQRRHRRAGRGHPADRRRPATPGSSAATSACGVCGTESIDDVLALCDGRRSVALGRPGVRPEVLASLPGTLRAEQRVFECTGGLHAAGLFDANGTALVVREDIGRHNAVDKVVGARLLAGASPAEAALCVSGRIGFEIVQKAVIADVGVVAAVGAPSSLAVDLAARAGLGTCGFREGRPLRRVLSARPSRRVTRLFCRQPLLRSRRAHAPHVRLAPGTLVPRGRDCSLPRPPTSTT